ncbi:MAG: hypothetical protein QRY74_04505 [Chlamydia sp.]
MPDENEKREQEKERTSESQLKSPALAGISEIFRANRGDTIAYAVMSLGLFLCFFGSFGGLLVGFVMGLYFSKTIIGYPVIFQEFLVAEGIFRGFIVIGSILALCISAPGLAIGVVLGALARPLFGNSIHDVISSAKEEAENVQEEITEDREEKKEEE